MTSGLERRIAEEMGADPSLVATLMEAARAGHLCVEWEGRKRGNLVEEEGQVYLPRYWRAQERVVEGIKPLLAEAPPLEALGVRSTRRLLLLCGGPGTGKTYTARHLALAFGGTAVMTAPTGKATARLGAQKTLHALLQRGGKLGADLVIVDEASMLDVELLAALLEGLAPGSRLVLMGDPDQLPPVEVGGLFGALVSHPDLAPCLVRLEESKRTDRKELLDLAGAVRNGDADLAMELMKPNMWRESLETFPEGWRVLSPLRSQVERINGLLHREGEVPIMITRNDYTTGLFNGETGVLRGSWAQFGERKFPLSALPPYELAYCLSVHKSQGSEFDAVVALVPEGSQRFGRGILYTAITRAREKLLIVGSERVLRETIEAKVERLCGIWHKHFL